MSLDKELAAALGREAEMREVPLPDVEGLIRGGRARRRRRTVGRIGVVAAAAVLVGGGAYGVAHVVPGDAGTVAGPLGSEPSEAAGEPPSFQHLNGEAIEPGTYRMLVGFDPAVVKIEADLTVTGPNWTSGDQPAVSEGDSWAGVGVYQPDALAGVTPCYSGWQSRPASGNPQALARQLVRLPWGTVVQPPTPTEAFGHNAIHLRLRIDDQCSDYYQVAAGPARSRGISAGTGPIAKEVLIDFWVVDLNGTAVVVDMWHQVDASTELVGRATQARDSITFVTPE